MDFTSEQTAQIRDLLRLDLRNVPAMDAQHLRFMIADIQFELADHRETLEFMQIERDESLTLLELANEYCLLHYESQYGPF